MKKLMILMTVLVMTLSMAGCSSGNEEDMANVNANGLVSNNDDGNMPSGEMERPDGEVPEGEAGERSSGGPGGEGFPGGMPSMEASAIPVNVTSITHESMKESLITSGTVMPNDEVTIGSDSGETIETLMVEAGDVVAQGDILYTFDMDETELNSKSSLINASQAIDSARLNLENAQADYDDTLAMYEKDYATEAELESADQALKSSQLMYDQAVTDYSTIKEQTDYDLSSSVYYAPVSGIIADMSAMEDQRATTSDFTIIDAENLLIETVVSGDRIKDLEEGDEVIISYGETDLTGVIDEIDIIGINDTDSYYVYILVPSEGDVLRYGFSVDVAFTVKELEDQVVLPKKTVLTDAYGDYVYVAVDGTAQRVDVEQGITQDGYVQIISDLKDGDMVIVEGQYLVSEGGAVLLPGQEVLAGDSETMPNERPEGGSEEMPGEKPEGGPDQGESREEAPAE